ncbi:uncharacterized protein LOC135166237 [Diachasmimorpha longicaudata]|uniref:uncharacterized protein LOC135166237 n=1 Tax=Diachasmimorpha longicaudata TaxID=58733 RepID=UPI0030B8C107
MKLAYPCDAKMKLTVSITIIFLISSSSIRAALENEITDQVSSNVTQPSKDSFHSILLECQNSDYRTYIQCLKRHKRHHEHHDYSDATKNCFADCGLDECSSTHCVHQCHTKCMKKVKEIRQFITEFETVCSDDNCTSRPPASAPNITTNIDINNYINNSVKAEPPKPNDPKLNDPKPVLFPPIRVLSEVTIGGCINYQSWPCISRTQPTNFDCSLCINVWYKYQCELHCCGVSMPGPQGPSPFTCSGHV